MSLRRFYAVVYDYNFPSHVDSLLLSKSSRVASSFLHAAMNLRPPSVTASTHTSASNAVASQPPAMPNARMSLCTQSVHSFSFPLRPLRNAPSRFPNTIRFVWQSPTAHSDKRPRPQKSSRAQRRLNAVTPGYLKMADVNMSSVLYICNNMELKPDDGTKCPRCACFTVVRTLL